jgi:hypothetical protein
VARPFAAVTAVVTRDPLKFALAPDDGAVKVTVTPETGLELESVTSAINCPLKAVLIVVLCPDPVAVIEAGAGLLVRAKLAAVTMPVTLAVTL